MRKEYKSFYKNNLTLRIDDKTLSNLDYLSNYYQSGKAEIIRKALRIFYELKSFQDKHGTLYFKDNTKVLSL